MACLLKDLGWRKDSGVFRGVLLDYAVRMAGSARFYLFRPNCSPLLGLNGYNSYQVSQLRNIPPFPANWP